MTEIEDRGLGSDFDISREMEAAVDRVFREIGLDPEDEDLLAVRYIAKLAWLEGARYGGIDGVRIGTELGQEAVREIVRRTIAIMEKAGER